MQSARLVQSGEGDRRFVVLLYLIHPDRDPALREALGPKPMILARADDGDPGPTFWQEIAAHLGAMPGAVPTGYVLGGWSAGCSGVRKRLLEAAEFKDEKFKAELRALVLADGTHASLPPQPWQLDVWRPWIEKARGGEELDADPEPDSQNETEAWTAWLARRSPPVKVPSFVFAASHTYQTYVEHLPGGKAYTSTVNVLRALTGFVYVRQTGYAYATQTIGDLHVESYPSAAIDGPAHIRQQTHALPWLLARYVRPMIEAAIL